MEKIFAWHFTTADKRLRYGDNRIVRAGRSLSVKFPFTTEDGSVYDKPTLCKAGMHASVRLFDALANAPGPYLWRVELSGEVVSDDEKSTGTTRKALWGFDATHMLRDFARKCALDVAHLWSMPLVVRQFLETGDEGLRAAARDAARDAAWAAAWAAARSAAWAAARDAARDAAWAAAWAAARSAARDADRAAAWAAAWAAARDAAWAAARDAQENRLVKMAYEYADRTP